MSREFDFLDDVGTNPIDLAETNEFTHAAQLKAAMTATGCKRTEPPQMSLPGREIHADGIRSAAHDQYNMLVHQAKGRETALLALVAVLAEQIKLGRTVSNLREQRIIELESDLDLTEQGHKIALSSLKHTNGQLEAEKQQLLAEIARLKPVSDQPKAAAPQAKQPTPVAATSN